MCYSQAAKYSFSGIGFINTTVFKRLHKTYLSTFYYTVNLSVFQPLPLTFRHVPVGMLQEAKSTENVLSNKSHPAFLRSGGGERAVAHQWRSVLFDYWQKAVFYRAKIARYPSRPTVTMSRYAT